MKKILSLISLFIILLVAAPMAFAAESEQELPDVTVTVPTDNVPAASEDFTFDSSPNVGVTIFTSATAYSITTANTLTGSNLENGLEFGTLATATGYAQRTKTTIAGQGPQAADADNDLPEGENEWQWMGGGGGS
jgi:hypothetical protein